MAEPPLAVGGSNGTVGGSATPGMEYSPCPKEGAFSCCDGKKVYLLGGDPGFGHYVDIFDIETRQWTRLPTEGSVRPRLQVGSSCIIIKGHLYVFGGFFRGVLNNNVYQLDLKTFHWKLLEPVSNTNEPMLKNKHGMVSHGYDLLLIFGGYGYPKVGSRLQDEASYDVDDELMWTNEIHLFHLREKLWIVPDITGLRPQPCAAFTFNRIDRHRVLLFGGRQKAERVNEVHILDTSTWVCLYIINTVCNIVIV